MRILFLSERYRTSSDGQDGHFHSLSTHLAARGHQVAVATPGDPGQPARAQEAGVRIYRMGDTRRQAATRSSDECPPPPPLLPDPGLILALRQIIARERPQIVHAHGWLVRSFLPLKRWSGARLVLTLSTHDLRCPQGRLQVGGEACPGPRLDRCVGCASAHYGLARGLAVLLAHPAGSVAVRFGVDAFVPVSQSAGDGNDLNDCLAPMRVIPGFGPEDVDDLPNEPHELLAQLPPGDFLLAGAALEPAGGGDVLLQAYAGLRGAPPLAILSSQGHVHRASAPVFPPSVHLLHGWPRAAVLQAWRRSLFGVAPITWPDPWPSVALDAMAMARPLVASRLGGLTDLVADEVSGLLVPPGDPAALREAMARLIASPSLRARMGQASRRRLAAFQADSIVPRIEELYRTLLVHERRPSPLRAPPSPAEPGEGSSPASNVRHIGNLAIGGVDTAVEK